MKSHRIINIDIIIEFENVLNFIDNDTIMNIRLKKNMNHD